jgi:F-type H+-transporting ATPase subunit delta
MKSKKNENQKLINIYSKALFASALENNILKEISSDLKSLQELTDNVKEVARIAKDQTLKYKQPQLVKSLLTNLQFNKITNNFLIALASNFRFVLLDKIIAKFNQALSHHMNEENIEVISSTIMNEEEINNLQERLTKSFAKKINLTTSVDRNLLGGIIIKYGSKMLDFSLRNKLDIMRKISKEKIGSV